MIGSVHKGRVGPSTSRPFVIKELPSKPIGGFVEGRVCKRCNEGWMSKLESAVKPLLVPILDTPTLVDEWSIEDREVLARWAVKTSLMAISVSIASSNVPEDHFTAIKKSIIPAGISVFAGYHFMGDKGFSYEAGRHWHVDAPAETPHEVRTEILHTVHKHSYKVCLQFRSLLLMTVFSPTRQLVVSCDSATHQLVLTEAPVAVRSNPVFTGPRIPLGMLLASDDARRSFADLMRIIYMPVPQ